jgi:hypothetical protein
MKSTAWPNKHVERIEWCIKPTPVPQKKGGWTEKWTCKPMGEEDGEQNGPRFTIKNAAVLAKCTPIQKTQRFEIMPPQQNLWVNSLGSGRRPNV